MEVIPDKQRTKLRYVVLIATAFSLLVIALGAYTRLVHAGLGCPDWPLCYGHLWAPAQAADIASANLNFPEAPVDLAKTWPEMTHRYLATSLGVFCIAIVVMSLRIRRTDKEMPIKHPTFLLLFIILQGLFGMWTVTLKLWPQVVTLHLVGGFTTFCLLLLLYLRLGTAKVVEQDGIASGKLAKLALAVTAVQIIIGGWVTSNYAAMACTSLPFCNSANFNLADVQQGFNFLQQIGPNYLGGQLDGGARVAIHAMHRFGALAVIIMLGLLIVSLARAKQKKAMLVVASLGGVQIILGLSNVYFNLPLFNAVAHNVVGAMLVGALVWVNYSIRREKA